MEILAKLRRKTSETKIIIMVIVFLFQSLLVALLFRNIGPAGSTSALLTVLVGSLLLGAKKGILISLMAILLNLILMAIYLPSYRHEFISFGAVSGLFALLVSGFIIGYLSDIAFELITSREHLHKLIANKTDELQKKNQILEAEIKERQSGERNLHKVNKLLAESNQNLNHFLAGISHELRTPLTMIMGHSDALREALYGELNDEQLRASEQIFQSSDYLLKLIERILDFSRFKTKNVALQLDVIPAVVIAKFAIEMVDYLAAQKGIQIQFENHAGEVAIEIDEVRVMQILINLLDNAIKFTPENQQIGLTISLNSDLDGLAGQDHEMDHIRFAVWDTGIGIAADDVDIDFEAFVRLEKTQVGTGLGLSLVRQMVDLHQGKIHVKSQLGQGSQFTVLLPISQT